ncbi:MAG: hypothetical protein WC843_00785 [Candidatus Gracilibacteria bacterium]|jgi:antitoxin component of RelBE/YafQ-DinJ toxin-antitoxin module
MTTISFKADEKLKNKLETVAKDKGINTSAYIKLILTKEVNNELATLTSNGLTVAEEMEILKSAESDKKYGPFDNVKDLLKSLKK